MLVHLPLPRHVLVFDVGLVRAVAPGIVSELKEEKSLPICEMEVSTN